MRFQIFVCVLHLYVGLFVPCGPLYVVYIGVQPEFVFVVVVVVVVVIVISSASIVEVISSITSNIIIIIIIIIMVVVTFLQPIAK